MKFSRYFEIEKKIAVKLKPFSILLIRLAFGIIYVWFGILKVLGISPLAELVHLSTYWLGTRNFTIFLGFWEVAIGICFFVKKLNRLGLLLFFLHLPGTFLPLFTNPEDCFTIFPYGLTLEGQYIFKNLISIAAAIVVFCSLPKEENLGSQ